MKLPLNMAFFIVFGASNMTNIYEWTSHNFPFAYFWWSFQVGLCSSQLLEHHLTLAPRQLNRDHLSGRPTLEEGYPKAYAGRCWMSLIRIKKNNLHTNYSNNM